MKSIKTRIILVILPLVLILCTFLGGMSCYLNYGTATAVLEQSLLETAITASNHVSAEIKSIQNIAIETGCIEKLSNSEISLEEKDSIIKARAKSYNFQRGNLLNAQGISLFDGNDYSERDYFKASIKGSSYISDPVISKVTGKTTFLISAPLWKDGMPGSTIVGVIYYAPYENFLNDIVANINVSASGSAILLNKNGTTVADKDPTLVSVDNHIIEAQNDKSLKALAEVHTKMIAGETGYDSYNHDGHKWVHGYAPVSNTDGWSIGIMAKESDFLGNFYLSIWTTLIVVVLFLIFGTAIAIIFGNQIGNPIKKCVARLELLSEGNLSADVPIVNSKDETGVLAQVTATLTKKFSMVIGEVSDNLTEMSKGNLTVKKLNTYEGDFAPISVASNKIVDSLNDALSNINRASEQVSSGSDQVSSGAQTLSQGATEQASAIEELSSSIAEVSNHVKTNAENAKEASKLSTAAGNKLMGGNAEMENMLKAMTEMGNSSKKISYIIKTINDIAFQTNILALNAAVEAARAGSAGKGFAVVADEVRNLASKSAEAAANTTELIESSVKSVEVGSLIADKTAKILLEVMNESIESADLVNKIAIASSEQAQYIEQIAIGVDQISSVVQTNSATAEESAAASEELLGQAQLLKQLVDQFTLR